MITFPNAKINLGLNVINKRDDGYHNISSCFYPIPLCDVLEINLSRKFNFTVTGTPVPGDKNQNLVVKAYKLLKRDFDLTDITIHLHKHIPMEAGLGGGSSDGAFALNMLNELFDLFLEKSVLEEYAEKLGSDCPFFIYNRPAIISGRGDIIEEIELDLKGHTLSLIKPDIAVSTLNAYRDMKPVQPLHDINKVILEHPVREWKDLLKNDFETVIFKNYPVLSELKDKLYDMGALYASMTGSGSALYGIFEDPPERPGDLPEHYLTWIIDL